jgi:hypothetical protein
MLGVGLLGYLRVEIALGQGPLQLWPLLELIEVLAVRQQVKDDHFHR